MSLLLKFVFRGAAIWCFALLIGAPRADAGEPSRQDPSLKAPVVIELFTSQGCSSCPPADAILAQLAERDDVIALSFHVDYWDYIGWKDPFANPSHTRRQRRYAEQFGIRYVYTPQSIIQGMRQVVGSNSKDIDKAIQAARKNITTRIKVERSGSSITVTLSGHKLAEPADVLLVTFDGQHDTVIQRGENRGKTLRNRNVVRHLSRIGEWQGTPTTLTAGLPATTGRVGSAVFVQSRETGRIFGAGYVPAAH